MQRRFLVPALLCITLALAGPGPSQERTGTDYLPALAGLNPVGYWPLDDGTGGLARDLAPAQNHAPVFNTPWTGRLLDFSSAYQFAEIPGSNAYFGAEFTMAVWVFSRRASYERAGVALIGSWLREPLPVSLRLSGEGVLGVEVVSDRQPDVLGSLAAGIAMKANGWHHLAYTYREGRGTLYVDGDPVQAKEGVPYTPATEAYPILAGYDADWWGVHPAASQSLDGSLRGLGLFGRALSKDEVRKLYAATIPNETPHLEAPDEVRVAGRFISLGDLDTQAVAVQQQALETLVRRARGRADDEVLAAAMASYLPGALQEPALRYHGALVAQELGASAILDAALPRLADVVADPEASAGERASAALALGAMGGRVQPQSAVLRSALEEELKSGGANIPRVNEVFRNALIYALLRIAPDDPPARDVLGRAYAKPVLAWLGLDSAVLAGTETLVRDGRYLDALDAAKDLYPESGIYFLTQNDPFRDSRQGIHERSYTSMAKHGEFTFKFGEGTSYNGYEPIARSVYEEALARYGDQFPDAKNWLDGDYTRMRRANLQRIAPDGSVDTVYMGGDYFIFSDTDAKVNSWVVALDKKGYIHVMGGQHNAPDYENYMPGSWDAAGLSPSGRDPRHPTKLYWVSKKPADIGDFEFVGLRKNPRDVPVTYLNYMNFVQDNDGELYLYGRTDGWGFQSWGLFKYDVEVQAWAAVGGLAGDIIASAKTENPSWMDLLYKQYRGSIPDEGGPRLLSWAWQPHFYNYIRSNNGVQFDPDNRMVVQVGIRSVDEAGRYADRRLFAYSDDNGRTFCRADGSEVALPLSASPASAHNADFDFGMNALWLMQWNYLLSQAGLGG